MTIPVDTIERIRAAADIVEIIREYLPGIKRAGRNWKANCPFHNEKTPSFMVSPDKGIFHCFGCSAGGDVFKFVMQMDSSTWPEAVRKLGQRLGIAVEEEAGDPHVQTQRRKLLDILESAAVYYHRVLMTAAAGKRAREYLRGRGVTDDAMGQFRLGFAPAGGLESASRKAGAERADLAAAGLFTTTASGRSFEYMGGRVVFPITDTQGRVVAFGGRALGAEEPKYLNTPETAVYAKSQHLYGLHHALPSLRVSRRAILLEGYMDVLVTQQFGVGDTVAPLGTALTEHHARLLRRFADAVTVIFDADRAGEQAALRAVEVLSAAELPVRVATLPGGQDPDEYIAQFGAKAFVDLADRDSQPAHEYVTAMARRRHQGRGLESTMAAARDILQALEKVKNPIARAEWIRHASENLHVPEHALRAEITRSLPRRSGAKAAPPARTAEVGSSSGIEDQIIQLVAAHPEMAVRISPAIFSDDRARGCFESLARGASPSSIVAGFEAQDDVQWFTALMAMDWQDPSPDQTLVTLLRDLEARELQRERQDLEKEYINMIDGTQPPDAGKFARYRELTSRLKGSVKRP